MGSQGKPAPCLSRLITYSPSFVISVPSGERSTSNGKPPTPKSCEMEEVKLVTWWATGRQYKQHKCIFTHLGKCLGTLPVLEGHCKPRHRAKVLVKLRLVAVR